MGTPCPDCGADVELAERPIRLRGGRCGACGHELTVLSDVRVGSESPEQGRARDGSRESAEVGEGSSEESASPAEGGIPCPKCGGPLELTASEDHQLKAACADCGADFTYVLETGRGRGAGPRARPEREPREGGESSPRARPCRQCGAPLRFSTNEDGTVTGKCDSCGNEFTLPPRRTESWGDRRKGRFPSSDRRGPPRAGGWRPGGGRPRRFDRSEGRSGPPRRRRPRRDEDSD